MGCHHTLLPVSSSLPETQKDHHSGAETREVRTNADMESSMLREIVKALSLRKQNQHEALLDFQRENQAHLVFSHVQTLAPHMLPFPHSPLGCSLLWERNNDEGKDVFEEQI